MKSEAPPRSGEDTRHVAPKAPKGGSPNWAVLLLSAKCDELFPPSRVEFRIRNQACHLLYG